MTSVVTVRLDDDTKRKIKRYGIPVSKVARAAIQQEIERKQNEEALKALRRMKEILRKVDIKRTVEQIRADRESR
jgi:predicted transcriptional regulator